MKHAMMAAIKGRRSHGMPENDAAPPVGESKDLHGLVARLSDHEKSVLKGILDGHEGKEAAAIARGEPSSEEHGKIQAESSKEDARNDLKAFSDKKPEPHAPQQSAAMIGEEESDEIGKSLLDSKHLRGGGMEKPRNLGERVKQSIASKLKAKGKI